MKIVIINKNDENQRLDKFLSKTLSNLPMSLLYKYIRKKRIKINGKRCKASDKLIKGDSLELYISDEFLLPADKEMMFLSAENDIDILYEDENIILVNKKKGLIVHEDKNEKIDTLINRIKKYLYLNKEYIPQDEQSFVPALVNRIDRNTEGIIVAAKNSEALRILNQKLKDREIKKMYLCIVHGKLKNTSATLKNYMIKDSESNKVYLSNEYKSGYKTMLTRYKVLSTNGELSLLDVELLTGRTHQIRAHMAYIGHPLVGDTKYGMAKMNERYGVKSQVLISYKLVFNFESDGGLLNYLNGKSFVILNAKDRLNNMMKDFCKKAY